MAASIAADGIEKLADMILQKLGDEASLVFNFRKDFEWVADLKGYLKDAHHKSTQNDVKQWLRKLRDVSLDAEDIVDECAAESLYHHTTNKPCAFSCSLLLFKYKIGRRIRDLKARMSSINAEATTLRLKRDLAPSEQASTSSSRAQQWRRSSILESNARPVAIDAKVDKILKLFDDTAHQVLGVVGMGGVGKTFLLQNVYNHSTIKGKFEKCIWLSISQSYSLKKLQCDIASKLDLKNVQAT